MGAQSKITRLACRLRARSTVGARGRAGLPRRLAHRVAERVNLKKKVTKLISAPLVSLLGDLLLR